MSSLYAGVDLGGTTIGCGLGTWDGRLVCQTQIDTEAHLGPDSVLDRIAATIEQLSGQAGAKPAALGIGVPGLVDIEKGVTRFLPNLPTQWRNVPVADVLGKRLKCPVHVLNDVRVATLGELRYGHGKTAGTMVFFALGTGIGGGVAIDGKLRLGPEGAAGELGHLTVQPDGARCGCGSHGCIETLASGPALVSAGVRLMKIGLAPQLHRLVDGDAGRVSPKQMAEAAAAGDEAIAEAIARAGRFLGIAAASVITTLHPELVVLGGGVAEMGEMLLQPVREQIRQRVRMISPGTVQVKRSQLGPRAGLLGAVALAAGRLES